jgi:hypothetical protein
LASAPSRQQKAPVEGQGSQLSDPELLDARFAQPASPSTRRPFKNDVHPMPSEPFSHTNSTLPSAP